MSMAPSATLANFSDEPSTSLTAPSLAAMKASVAGSPCERLTAAIHGRPFGGEGRGADCFGALAAPRQPLGAPSDDAAPDQPQGGRADHAQNRAPVRHQSE